MPENKAADQMGNDLLDNIAMVVDRALYRHPSEMFPANSEREARPFDYLRMARILAAVDAARFFEAHFPLAENLIGKEALLRHACTLAPSDGAILEFGVMEGRTLRILAEAFPARLVHGFDSFQGLPEDWRHDKRAGAFSTDGKPPETLPENTQLHIGLFSQCIPAYKAAFQDKIALLHIDSDLYSSAHTVLFGLAERLPPGSIIVFDEYINYPGWREQEHKAFMEFVAAFDIRFSYVAFASSYLSVAIRINANPSFKD
jgi:hypothetical protein